MSNSEPIIVLPGESRGVLDHALKAGAAETGGAFALRYAAAMPPGRWIPEHIHRREEEAWFVISAALSFRVGGREFEAPAGSFVLVPRGTAHGFGNLGSEPASYLELFSPAGMEGYFEERFALARQHPPGANVDYAGLGPAEHEALAKKYGMERA